MQRPSHYTKRNRNSHLPELVMDALSIEFLPYPSSQTTQTSIRCDLVWIERVLRQPRVCLQLLVETRSETLVHIQPHHSTPLTVHTINDSQNHEYTKITQDQDQKKRKVTDDGNERGRLFTMSTTIFRRQDGRVYIQRRSWVLGFVADHYLGLIYNIFRVHWAFYISPYFLPKILYLYVWL